MKMQLKALRKGKITWKRLIVMGMALVLFIILILLFCLYWQSKESNIDNNNLPVVKVTKAKRQDMEIKIATTGILQCARQQDFYSRTASTVKEIRKTEGSKVTIGEVIMLLDNSQALVELGETESTLAVLQSDYLQGVSDKVLLMKKRDEVKKKLWELEELHRLEKVSFRDVEMAQLTVDDFENKISAINLSALESQVNKARLAVQAAREKLAASVITSPFEGTVLKMDVKRGQPVSKDKFLFSVGKIDSLEVGVSVNEYDAIKVKKGQQVAIYSEALKEKVYQGHVSHIAPLAEAEKTPTGMVNKVKMKIILDEKTEELKPGFTVNADILLEKKPHTLLVPSEAVIAREGKHFIFVYVDGVAQLREIQKGLTLEREQEITAGLEEGEMFIIDAQEKLEDNTKVKLADDKNK